VGAAGNALAAAAGGFAAGGIMGGNIQSAVIGALTAGLTSGLASGFGLHGAAAFGSGQHIGQIALHSAMGCASNAAAGGSCKAGAVSGAVSAFASPLLPADKVARLAGNAVIGGVASQLSGGKFGNGAVSAAFSYLFNEAGEARRAERSYRLRIIVHVDGPEDYVGHAFVMIEDGRGVEVARGHWPGGDGAQFSGMGALRLLNPFGAGQVINEFERGPRYAERFNDWAITGADPGGGYFAQRVWEINARQFTSVLGAMYSKSNDFYSIYNHCASWATSVSSVGGAVRSIAAPNTPATMFRSFGGRFD